jgi:hypothetical protein
MRASAEVPFGGSRGPSRIHTLLRHVSSPNTPDKAVATAAAAATSVNARQSLFATSTSAVAGATGSQKQLVDGSHSDSDSDGDVAAGTKAISSCPFRTLDGAPPGPLRRTIPDVFDPSNTDPDLLGMLIRPLDFVDELVDVTASLPIDPASVLPGPLSNKEKFPTFEEALRATLRANQKGVEHLLIEECVR